MDRKPPDNSAASVIRSSENAMSPTTEKYQYEVLDYEYKTLMSAMHVSVSRHLLDEHFTVLWANDCYYRTIGYPKEEYEALFHNHVTEYFKNDPDLLLELQKKVESAMVNGQDRYEAIFKMPVKGGKYIWTKLVGAFTNEFVDGKQIVYTIFSDISRVIKTEKERSVAYDNLPGFVAKFCLKNGRECAFVEANDRFVEFFGKRTEQDPPYALFNLDTPDNRQALSENLPLMREGKPVRFVVQVKNRHGEDAWLQLNAECIDWIRDDPVYLVIYIDITDVTELRELHKKLQERTEMLRSALEMAERASHAKSDFLSRMSHDIRTPLNAITGLISMARDAVNDPDRIADCLDKLDTSAQFLLSLINDILDMSKIESGKMELRNHRFNFAAFTRDIATLFYAQADKKRIAFHVDVSEKVQEWYVGDELKLKQIAFNLLGNAIKYTDAGGRIEFTVDEGQRTDKTRELVLSVSDTGIGMDAAFMSKIFQPFEQDKEQRENRGGSGLGLAIANSFVHLMNGSIQVTSAPGKGSTFKAHVWLNADNEIAETMSEQEDFSGLSILAVNTTSTPAENLEELLKRFGVTVKTVSSEEEALHELKAAGEQGKPYSVVLLEWKWPYSDVTGLARTIRYRFMEDIKLGVAAYDAQGIRSEIRKAGIDYVLQKPLFTSTVREFLQSVIQPVAEKAGETAEVSLIAQKVLLVEDNDINREIAKMLLETRQLKVDTATNGQEAVEKFLVSLPESYLAILMDVQMPVMNGLDATRVIRGLPRTDAKTIPIIGLSANAFDEDVEKSLEAGMNVYLPKPIDLSRLFEVLRQYGPKKEHF